MARETDLAPSAVRKGPAALETEKKATQRRKALKKGAGGRGKKGGVLYEEREGTESQRQSENTLEPRETVNVRVTE
ncbi:hypothetical protein ROHU_029811 [Labeo rohita]|uniref:Uncharacterized protein n=1 Tax=Labeo rohita TaxID=84645 RepID=A0A498LWU8_LABRO|nr:hypothetical protein ROHU_029811 [Labeo rohita]